MYPSAGNHPMHGCHNPSQPAVNHGGSPFSATNINISLQVSLQQQQGHPSRWTTGLCGCGEDCCNCCLTFWCPCITFGQIAEIADSGSTSCGLSGALYALLLYFTGCACCYSCFYRKILRSKFNLEEKPCGDCLVHFCCEYCALCQEYRELKNRGFDPSLGWEGNRGRQGQSAFPAGIATAPPMGQAMYN